MTARRVARIGAGVLGTLLIAAQAVRPARTNPAIAPSRAIQHAVPITGEVQAILDRGCADCHSNRTTWPWYSNVAPVSWFVIDHVNHGRRHLDFSNWARLTPREADRLLGEICSQTTAGSMPMSSYLLMHRAARLSPADVRTLCAWTNTAQAAVRHGSGQ